jgi:hypothetical protein
MKRDIYPVGTQFKPIGKHAQVCTIRDVLFTRNLAGELVNIRYVADHDFCGQIVTNRDVVAATIARGLISTP